MSEHLGAHGRNAAGAERGCEGSATPCAPARVPSHPSTQQSYEFFIRPFVRREIFTECCLSQGLMGRVTFWFRFWGRF